jgi:hypothetical protein
LRRRADFFLVPTRGSRFPLLPFPFPSPCLPSPALKSLYYYHADLGLALDISRIPFPDDFLAFKDDTTQDHVIA